MRWASGGDRGAVTVAAVVACTVFDVWTPWRSAQSHRANKSSVDSAAAGPATAVAVTPPVTKNTPRVTPCGPPHPARRLLSQAPNSYRHRRPGMPPWLSLAIYASRTSFLTRPAFICAPQQLHSRSLTRHQNVRPRIFPVLAPASQPAMRKAVQARGQILSADPLLLIFLLFSQTALVCDRALSESGD